MVKQFFFVAIEHVVRCSQETQACTIFTLVIYPLQHPQALGHLPLLANQVVGIFRICPEYNLHAVFRCRHIDQQYAQGLEVVFLLQAHEQLTGITTMVHVDNDESGEVSKAHVAPTASLLIVVFLLRVVAYAHGKF